MGTTKVAALEVAPAATKTPLECSSAASLVTNGLSPDAATALGSATRDQGLLSCWTKSLLGLGGAVNGIYVFVGGFYINNFFLETCCLDPVEVGFIQLFQCVFDAVNDPIVGFLSDRTRTRWGRRRPWLLFGAPFLALSYVGLWQALPLDTPDGLRFTYHLLTYMCVSVGVTMVDTQINALVPELTQNYDERTVVSAYRAFVANTMGLISVVAHSIIVSSAADKAQGSRKSSLILAASMWLLTWIVFAGIQEQFNPNQERSQSLSLLTGLRLVFTNRAFGCVCAMYVFGPMAVYMMQANLVMYCKYALNNESLLPAMLPAVIGTSQLSLGFWVWVSSRFGKRRAFICGGLVMLTGFTALGCMPTTAPGGVHIAVATLIGAGIIVPYFIPVSMLPDVIEDDELRSGERREGVFAGFFTTPLKLSVALGATATNVGLKAASYASPASSCTAGAAGLEGTLTEELDTQPESVVWILRMYLSPIPAVLIVLSMIFAYRFPITRETHIKMLTEVKRLREENFQRNIEEKLSQAGSGSLSGSPLASPPSSARLRLTCPSGTSPERLRSDSKEPVASRQGSKGSRHSRTSEIPKLSSDAFVRARSKDSEASLVLVRESDAGVRGTEHDLPTLPSTPPQELHLAEREPSISDQPPSSKEPWEPPPDMEELRPPVPDRAMPPAPPEGEPAVLE